MIVQSFKIHPLNVLVPVVKDGSTACVEADPGGGLRASLWEVFRTCLTPLVYRFFITPKNNSIFICKIANVLNRLILKYNLFVK